MSGAGSYLGVQEGRDGRLVPVYRVKAWRVANEDCAPWSVVLQRAVPPLPDDVDPPWPSWCRAIKLQGLGQ